MKRGDLSGIGALTKGNLRGKAKGDDKSPGIVTLLHWRVLMWLYLKKKCEWHPMLQKVYKNHATFDEHHPCDKILMQDAAATRPSSAKDQTWIPMLDTHLAVALQKVLFKLMDGKLDSHTKASWIKEECVIKSVQQLLDYAEFKQLFQDLELAHQSDMEAKLGVNNAVSFTPSHASAPAPPGKDDDDEFDDGNGAPKDPAVDLKAAIQARAAFLRSTKFTFIIIGRDEKAATISKRISDSHPKMDSAYNSGSVVRCMDMECADENPLMPWKKTVTFDDETEQRAKACMQDCQAGEWTVIIAGHANDTMARLKKLSKVNANLKTPSHDPALVFNGGFGTTRARGMATGLNVEPFFLASFKKHPSHMKRQQRYYKTTGGSSRNSALYGPRPHCSATTQITPADKKEMLELKQLDVRSVTQDFGKSDQDSPSKEKRNKKMIRSLKRVKGIMPVSWRPKGPPIWVECLHMCKPKYVVVYDGYDAVIVEACDILGLQAMIVVRNKKHLEFCQKQTDAAIIRQMATSKQSWAWQGEDMQKQVDTYFPAKKEKDEEGEEGAESSDSGSSDSDTG